MPGSVSASRPTTARCIHPICPHAILDLPRHRTGTALETSLRERALPMHARWPRRSRVGAACPTGHGEDRVHCSPVLLLPRLLLPRLLLRPTQLHWWSVRAFQTRGLADKCTRPCASLRLSVLRHSQRKDLFHLPRENGTAGTSLSLDTRRYMVHFSQNPILIPELSTPSQDPVVVVMCGVIPRMNRGASL